MGFYAFLITLVPGAFHRQGTIQLSWLPILSLGPELQEGPESNANSPLGRGLATGRAALSYKRKPCSPSSCLEPGAWAFWFLRGLWPAQTEKGARFFSLLQLAAIVEKVNTPHSLTSKSSRQEWEVIKSLFHPSRGEPTRAGLCPGAPREH